MNIFKSVIRPFFFKTKEDRVIDQLKCGNTVDFINFFTFNTVQFTGSRRYMKSSTGRVIYDATWFYSQVYIDGVDISEIPIDLPYKSSEKIRRAIKCAVMSNCPGTVPYEEKRFNNRTEEIVPSIWEIHPRQISSTTQRIGHNS